MILLTLLLTLGSAEAACPTTPVDLTMLSDHLDHALDHYAVGEGPAFESEASQAMDLLPCLHDPISRETAARLHLVEGMLRLDATPADAEPYLAAAQRDRLRPDRLPATLEKGPIADALNQEHPDAGTQTRLPPSAGGRLQVDGVITSLAPDALPYVLQRVQVDGRVTGTSYVFPGAAPSAYPRLRTRLLTVALGGAVVSAAGWVGAEALHHELFSKDWTKVSDEGTAISKVETWNNVLFITGVTFGAVGLGATAGFAWSFR